VVSETELAHRYADLSLIVRPDMRQFKALDLLLEFKFIGLKQLNLSGQQIKQRSRDELAKLPLVAAKLDQAAAQAEDYGSQLNRRYDISIRSFAVVALGFERVVWRELKSKT